MERSGVQQKSDSKSIADIMNTGIGWQVWLPIEKLSEGLDLNP